MLIVWGQSRQRMLARKEPTFGQKTVNRPRIGQKHPQWAFVLCPPTARRRRRSILASPFITLLIPNYRNVWFILNPWGRYTASANRKVTTATLGYLPCHPTVQRDAFPVWGMVILGTALKVNQVLSQSRRRVQGFDAVTDELTP